LVGSPDLRRRSPELAEAVRPFCRKTEKLVRARRRAVIFFHRDADGICSAAIFDELLGSLGVDTELRPVLPGDLPSLEPSDELNVFLDVGSGQIDILRRNFSRSPALVVDHHRPVGQDWPSLIHINPYLLGSDGSIDVCGAGLSYLVSRALGRAEEMSPIAVIGAVADRQDFLGELQGTNRLILSHAEAAGLVREEKDVLLFGRESRPLHIALSSFQDPPIPGVTGSEAGALELLSLLGIQARNSEGFRTLRDLSEEERRRLATEIVVRCASSVPPSVVRYVPRLVIGSVYRMVHEESPLEYASEFASFLNASVRMGKVEEAISLVKGHRGDALQALRRTANEYRRAISVEIRKLSLEGVRTGPRGILQYFVSSTLPAELLGPVTGLLIGTGVVDPYRPVMGISRRDRVKVSVRCSKLLVLQGLDLSICVERAARSVGATGGGHPGAAGAFMEAGLEEDFALKLEEEIANLGAFKAPPPAP